jgi:hypothetical protein
LRPLLTLCAPAESVSMAAVAYTSTLAGGELYESERTRELRRLELAAVGVVSARSGYVVGRLFGVMPA